MGFLGFFVVKCYDFYCVRSCYIRRFGLSDLFFFNVVVFWFSFDKCGLLGLIKMNVFVYGSRLSIFFRELMDLGLK